LCVPIAGATGASYVVTAADAGHALAALVLTGTDAAASAALSTAAGVP
jgi:NADH:ubiquinone oxidoreductase subunit 6 (subunit J)